MTVKHETVTVGTTATSLIAGTPDQRPKSNAVVVTRAAAFSNTGTVSIFIGGPGVTPSNYGYELKAGERLPMDLTASDEPFGVVATGTGTVRALYVGA